jgi:hypothetical protein
MTIEAFYARLAAELDRIGAAIPAVYELNLVLVHRENPAAHIVFGKTDPRQIAEAISATIANPGRVGIANAAGVEFEI